MTFESVFLGIVLGLWTVITMNLKYLPFVVVLVSIKPVWLKVDAFLRGGV